MQAFCNSCSDFPMEKTAGAPEYCERLNLRLIVFMFLINDGLHVLILCFVSCYLFSILRKNKYQQGFLCF